MKSKESCTNRNKQGYSLPSTRSGVVCRYKNSSLFVDLMMSESLKFRMWRLSRIFFGAKHFHLFF